MSLSNNTLMVVSQKLITNKFIYRRVGLLLEVCDSKLEVFLTDCLTLCHAAYNMLLYVRDFVYPPDVFIPRLFKVMRLSGYEDAFKRVITLALPDFDWLEAKAREEEHQAAMKTMTNNVMGQEFETALFLIAEQLGYHGQTTVSFCDLISMDMRAYKIIKETIAGSTDKRLILYKAFHSIFFKDGMKMTAYKMRRAFKALSIDGRYYKVVKMLHVLFGHDEEKYVVWLVKLFLDPRLNSDAATAIAAGGSVSVDDPAALLPPPPPPPSPASPSSPSGDEQGQPDGDDDDVFVEG